MAGVGGIAGLEWKGEKFGVEIEPEWAEQARERGLDVHIGDARDLKWPNDHFGVICTAPADGTRAEPVWAPKSARFRNYQYHLGRDPTPGNGGALPWGDKYCILHAQVWMECVRVLHPGGLLVVNANDHIRNDKHYKIARWHLKILESMGMEVVRIMQLPIKKAVHDASEKCTWVEVDDFEWVYVLRKPRDETKQ